MEQRIPLEKKMELAQYIREENMGNRMKIRQRENILYGTDTQPPLYTKDVAAYSDRIKQENGKMSAFSSGTFKYRMIVAVILFAVFLLCDTNSGKIGQYTTDDVYRLIAEDTFDLEDILAFEK